MSLQAAAAAAADGSAGTTRDDASVDMTLHGTIAHSSQRALLDSAQLHGSGKDTTLQCDNDLKSGTGCSPSPLPAVPSKLHAVFATHETERASARAAQEVVHPAYSTSLPGATALKSGRGYTDLTAEAT